MRPRANGYANCIENRGAGDLRKVYRVLHDKEAAAAGYVRVVDESGDDYLYPAHCFVPVDLPPKAKRAWTGTLSLPMRQRSSPSSLQRAALRQARHVR